MSGEFYSAWDGILGTQQRIKNDKDTVGNDQIWDVEEYITFSSVVIGKTIDSPYKVSYIS